MDAKKVILCYNNHKIQWLINLILLLGKFHIHKSKFARNLSCFELFVIELRNYIEYIKLINDKKCQQAFSLIQQLI